MGKRVRCAVIGKQSQASVLTTARSDFGAADPAPVLASDELIVGEEWYRLTVRVMSTTPDRAAVAMQFRDQAPPAPSNKLGAAMVATDDAAASAWTTLTVTGQAPRGARSHGCSSRSPALPTRAGVRVALDESECPRLYLGGWKRRVCATRALACLGVAERAAP